MTPELLTQMLQLLEGLPPTAKIIAIIVMALGVTASIVSSFLNANIRKLTDAGETVSKTKLTIASVLNFIALNLDKGVQLAKMAKGVLVPSTVTTPAAATPAAADDAPKPPAA